MCSCAVKVDNRELSPISSENITYSLPKQYSVDKIESAIEEYLNYILWNNIETRYDSNIGKNMEMDVRVYATNQGDKKIYAYYPQDEELFILQDINGVLYCTGQISMDNKDSWPQGNYETAGTLSVSVQSLRTPNFGSSERKNTMIAAAESKLRSSLCEDYLGGEDRERWVGATAFIPNFFEYEDVISAWIERQDGFIVYSPISIEERDGEMIASGVKGFEIKKDELLTLNNDLGKVIYERNNTVIIKEITCN